MSKTINLKTTDDVVLHKMTEEQIRQMVIKQADEMLKSVPKDLRISEVNSIKLESNLRQVAEIGGWAEWTRACCDKRRFIEDFVDPQIHELGITDPRIEKTVFQNHFDSNLSFKKITEPESLQKMKLGGKK